MRKKCEKIHIIQNKTTGTNISSTWNLLVCVCLLRFIHIKIRPIAKQRTQTKYIRIKLRHHKNTEYYIRLLYLRAARLCVCVCARVLYGIYFAIFTKMDEISFQDDRFHLGLIIIYFLRLSGNHSFSTSPKWVYICWPILLPFIAHYQLQFSHIIFN